MYVKDHNGNKCVHFLCYPNIEMYLVFIYYAYVYNVLHFRLNQSINPTGLQRSMCKAFNNCNFVVSRAYFTKNSFFNDDLVMYRDPFHLVQMYTAHEYSQQKLCNTCKVL